MGKKIILFVYACCFAFRSEGQVSHLPSNAVEQAFFHPSEDARPWVFWYWMYGAVSHEGITADLQAMKDDGIGGAYLMPIKAPGAAPMIDHPVTQLSSEWWDMIKFTMQEADRIGVKLAMHDCDGFALAGGPWITPELSMQKVVWSKRMVKGGSIFRDTLPVPAHYKNYYRDIEVLAYPSLIGESTSSFDQHPAVTTNVPNTDVQFLADRDNKKSFTSADPCWIQLEFDKPFTCRSLIIHTAASNYQSERLIVEVSDDGKTFRSLGRLTAPRHGWQDGDADITNDIPVTTAKYYRFMYDKTGSEPGSEDLDFAKWKPSLKLSGIELSAEPRIHQFEGKTGVVYRVSKQTTTEQLPNALCVLKEKIINLTDKLSVDGHLNWTAPPGNWTIIRIGHTSTGHTNATGGGGIGLECDKFDPKAAKIQFDNWFGEAIKHAGPELAAKVLKIFHVDSWECGSQNWSPVFAAEFRKRRGYDLLPYLPVMAGVPVQSAETSEKVLSDVRQTIAELLVDNFYGTMAKLAHEKGCSFTGESVAPVMASDGMLHYSKVDMPMGEFWLRSPSHDKPNDMLDAISGGHIYGKNIIQAEAFTELRIQWDEHPGMLKTMADRNFALGINRYVFHVNVHNPWLDRKPGMTLDGIGTFFQRDQTWWQPGKAWFDYIRRCQALLQLGHPVVDIAVFTGEETPRRALLPDRLVNTLPGIFGAKRVEAERKRLANTGEPVANTEGDASHSANMALPEDWIDPLNGYNYDSINKDALLRLATVRNGRVELPGGASYAILVIPGATSMNPNAGLMSPEVLRKLKELVAAGATIILDNKPLKAVGLSGTDAAIAANGKMLVAGKHGKGRILTGPYRNATFDALGLPRDLIATDPTGDHVENIAWTHRKVQGGDLYFISNQEGSERNIRLSFRAKTWLPEKLDAVTGKAERIDAEVSGGRSRIRLKLPQNGSAFILLDGKSPDCDCEHFTPKTHVVKTLENWQAQFDPAFGGPKQPVHFDKLSDWSQHANDSIKYYSGTAVYTQTFSYVDTAKSKKPVWLDLGKVYNMAHVYLNGVDCGVAWTYPYRVDISKAIKPGQNQLEIKVTNTWANRLIGDHALPENKRITWTNAAYKLDGKPLLPAGLLGPVTLQNNVPDRGKFE